jgi:hypothetical protein
MVQRFCFYYLFTTSKFALNEWTTSRRLRLYRLKRFETLVFQVEMFG